MPVRSTLIPKSPDRPRIYLAGPEVFLRKPLKIGAAKVAICAVHGLEGRFPLDAEIDLAGLSLEAQGLAIFRANERLLEDCDALIANMTPPSAAPAQMSEQPMRSASCAA